MRPISLRLQAFGSFAGVEFVDFAALAQSGLFVVGGPTGSGKTTIFDGIAFALYGRAAGDRTTELRSHHAGHDMPTEVELVFEIEGIRYRVTRRPAQDRPRRSGTGSRSVQLQPTAELYEYRAAGWQGLSSRPSEVTTLCTELVGLDLHQFQRVVLLPQGDFAQFLLSGTLDRQSLLRRLFGTDTYRRASAWWLDEAKRLNERVTDVDREMEHHRRSAIADLGACDSLDIDIDTVADESSPQALSDAVDHGLAALAPRRSALADLRAVAVGAREQATRCGHGATVFDELQASLAEQAALLVRRSEVEADLVRIDNAVAAAPVVHAAQAHASAVESHLLLQVEADHVEAQVLAGCAELALAVPVSPSAAIAVLASHGERLAGQHDLVARSTRAASEAVQAHDALRTADAARDVCSRRIERDAAALRADEERCIVLEQVVEYLVALEADMGQLDAAVHGLCRVQSIDQQVESARGRYDVAQRSFVHLTQAFAVGVAPRLAAQLVDGEPCSVCGSDAHPAPAQFSPDVPSVDANQVDHAAALLQQCTAELAHLAGTLQQATDDLPDHARAAGWSAAAIAAFEHRRAGVSSELADARGAGDELVVLRERAKQRATALTDRQAELAGLNEVVAAATERQRIALDAAEVAHAETQGLDDARIETARALVADIERLAGVWLDASATASSAGAQAAVAAGELAEVLHQSAFFDTASAREMALPDALIVDLRRSATAWQRALASLEARISTLQPLAPVERPDEALARHDADAAQHAADTESAAVAAIERYLSDASASLAAAHQLTGSSFELREAATTAHLVAQTCSGNVAPKVALETWVLAAELDRVTAQATVHLQRMSKQRYSLRRCDEVGVHGNKKSGLDIEVFDAHTGRTRGPQSLSGGERFQASLALALGLADVVSQGGSGSGKVFEALFVDEGFGSLDPEALDDAIEALHHLQQNGRMVGVITHVEAMKQQLPLGFEVRHRADGRGSTIVQPGVLPSPSEPVVHRAAKRGVSAARVA